MAAVALVMLVTAVAHHPATGRAAEPTPPPVDTSALPTQFTPPASTTARQVAACVEPSAGAEPTKPAQAWAPRRLRLPQAWRFGGGRGQRIAVIDTGVSPHPRLAGRLVGGGDYVAGGDGLLDCDGHGTLVAGIAAAAASEAGDDFGGVAPQAEVISIRQTSAAYVVPGGSAAARGAGDTTTLARAVMQAVDLGANVINISEVACVPAAAAGSVAKDLHAAVRTAADRGVVVIAAAGNVGTGGCTAQNGAGQKGAGQKGIGTAVGTVVLPAWFDADVLTVGSVGQDGAASAFSMRGPWVDVAAPGAELVSLDPAGPGLISSQPKTAGAGADAGVQGTSFAAPAVAGLAALVRQRFPALTARQVIARITATAQRAAGGRDAATGYGTVDPIAALTAEPAVLTPPANAEPAQPLTGELAPSVAPTENPPVPLAVGAGAAVMAVMLIGAAVAVRLLRRQRARQQRRQHPEPQLSRARHPVRRPSVERLPAPAAGRREAVGARPLGQQLPW